MSPHHPGPSPSSDATNISTTMSVTETSRPVAGSFLPNLPPPQTYMTGDRDNGPLHLPPPSSLPYIAAAPLSMGRSRVQDDYREQHTPRASFAVNPHHSYEAQPRRQSASLQHILHDVPVHPRAANPSSSSPSVLTAPHEANTRDRQYMTSSRPSILNSPPQVPRQPQQRQERRIGQRKEVAPPKIETAYAVVPPQDTPYTPAYTSSASSDHPQDSPEPRSRTGSRTMQISGLISDSSSDTDDKYTIRVRQQPLAARACGFGERDRRVIDPPPIVQLTLTNPSLTQEQIIRKLRSPFSVIHCALWNATTDEDKTTMPGVTDRRPQRRLMGTLVASPFVGRDENDEEGCFFCFPDLSCRTHGSYRLKFQLVILDPTRIQTGSSFPILSTAMSEPFQVFNAKDFPGMRASTSLTKKLKEQGCLISVKKGNDKHNATREESLGEDDPEGDESVSGRAKRPKR